MKRLALPGLAGVRRAALAAALAASPAVAQPAGDALTVCDSRRDVPAGFVSRVVGANGTGLHVVEGGEGPPVVLLHGFPEDWTAWAEMMPRLAERHRVVAVDLRGIGRSEPPGGGYDVATMADDMAGLIAELALDRPYIVGADIGGGVAYAFMRKYPERARGIMLIDVPIEGLDPWDEVKAAGVVRHFHMFQPPGLAETLLAGRESAFIGYFLRAWVSDPAAISEDDVARYTCAYARPGRMAAAMGMYRAVPQNEAFGREQRGPVDVPVAVVAGEKAFGPLAERVGAALREAGVASVDVEVVDGSHYLMDEQPERVRTLIEDYAGR